MTNVLTRLSTYSTASLHGKPFLEMHPLKSFQAFTKCLLVVPFLFTLGQRYDTRERTFYKLKDQSLVGNVSVVRQIKDVHDCSFLCMEYGPFTCLSFNFNNTLNENGFHFCELSNVSEFHLEPQRKQEIPGIDYYGMTNEVCIYLVTFYSIVFIYQFFLMLTGLG